MDSWLDQHEDIKLKIEKEVHFELVTLETTSRARYAKFKLRVLRVASKVQSEEWKSRSSDDIRNLIALIFIEGDFDKAIAEIDPSATKEQKSSGLFSSIASTATAFGSKFGSRIGLVRGPDGSQAPIKNLSQNPAALNAIVLPPEHDDIAFSRYLQSLMEKREEFKDILSEYRLHIHGLIRHKISKLASGIPSKVEQILRSKDDAIISQKFEERRMVERSIAMESLRRQVQDRLASSAPKESKKYSSMLTSLVSANSVRMALLITGIKSEGIQHGPHKGEALVGARFRLKYLPRLLPSQRKSLHSHPSRHTIHPEPFRCEVR